MYQAASGERLDRMKPFVRKIALLASLALVSGGLLVSTSATAGAQTGSYVQSKFNGRCMTAATGQHGAGIIMVDCVHAPIPRWSWLQLRLGNAESGSSLTAAGGNGYNGAHLQLYHCDASRPGHQTFYRPASHSYEVGRIRVMMPGYRCVEIAGANWWQGASVQLWDCHGGGNQYWW